MKKYLGSENGSSFASSIRNEVEFKNSFRHMFHRVGRLVLDDFVDNEVASSLKLQNVSLLEVLDIRFSQSLCHKLRVLIENIIEIHVLLDFLRFDKMIIFD